MCISVKCWGAQNFSTPVAIAVQIKLYWLKICTPHCFATHGKAILQGWLFLVNFLNYTFSLALLLLELLASDNCISLMIAFRTSTFQRKNKKRFHSIFNVHIWMHVTLQYAILKCMTLSAETRMWCLS